MNIYGLNDIDGGHENYIGNHIDEYESRLRQAFPRESDWFYEYGKWAGSKNYFFQFEYRNRNKKPDKPVVSKPESFLRTVEYIDWDVIGPGLTKEQAEAMYREIISHSKIYFIDRNDKKKRTIKMVPVEVPKDRM